MQISSRVEVQPDLSFGDGVLPLRSASSNCCPYDGDLGTSADVDVHRTESTWSGQLRVQPEWESVETRGRVLTVTARQAGSLHCVGRLKVVSAVWLA